jgi:hypothetical protein
MSAVVIGLIAAGGAGGVYLLVNRMAARGAAAVPSGSVKAPPDVDPSVALLKLPL